MKLRVHPDYIRNFIFGSEDALVSSVGVLFGLASSSDFTLKQILLAGIVVITVEALSMGAGAFLTEESVHEIEGRRNHKDSTVIDGLVMFFSYSIAGTLVLSPYLLLPITQAKYTSIAITLLLLFLLGVFPKKNTKDGIRMVIVAGGAILVGFLISNLVDTL